ncbi:acylglycerol lipase [Monocercomonoides exilis]|uniref:acylglycerol lipase n=1 Tax=Monocercomonoides exilis TaxID=2049356 RepID=UPI0035596B62|nr:acylglycerol lipase [Monocercomonoides exilis]|eukprot:MONOS_7117.1-p1 / transcript=MONOS_7117.1 / gene=MONOS_7117 / organism=Monocercomonoides_exilis_PA203 / gene_product=acylglycerol lipase [EC:3.1.1.23] / transcript_product=acylglycerol lipase [EC:3.1.1.23] / location=Mono_scaffold00236:73370-74855(-) / protein_length=367 / sequence_SO=supercontig / SO=protein_coding / is_pseudo=false
MASSSSTPSTQSYELQTKPHEYSGETLMSYYYRNPTPRGVIFYSHGVLEHTRCHMFNIEFFIRNGFSVFALDLPGHGLSAKGKVDNTIKDWRAVIAHWSAFIREISQEECHQNIPKFYFGHSLGATVGILVVRQVKDLLTGAIFSAPTVFVNAPGIAVAFLGPLSVVAKGVGVQKLDRTTLCHDAAIIKAANEDPLCGQKAINAQTANEIKHMTEEIKKHPEQDDYPFFIFHGDKDAIAPFKNSQMFFEKAVSKTKTLHIFQDTFHEIHNEPCKQECQGMILDWINRRISEDALKSSKENEAKSKAEESESKEGEGENEPKKEEEEEGKKESEQSKDVADAETTAATGSEKSAEEVKSEEKEATSS